MFELLKKNTELGVKRSKETGFGKIANVFNRGSFGDEVWGELEELLISADVGVETTNKLVSKVKQRVKADRLLDASQVREALKDEMVSLLKASPSRAASSCCSSCREGAPQVILVVGVNGSGKTTSIAKLAYSFTAHGERVVLLEAQPAAAPAVAGHSAELDAYGLPALLHRLAQGRATGTLNLLPREGGGASASISFSNGRPVAARWVHREGAEAVYQLFERPFPGTYAFDASAPVTAAVSPLLDLAALLKEGVRRARELQRTSAVPDELPLEATGAAPGTVVDEPEYDQIVALWTKACPRVPVRQMEVELAVDAYRILRPHAQWLEEGALKIWWRWPSVS